MSHHGAVVLRYALLGLLARRPMNGHDLSRAFAATVAAVWPASHRQIFPELGRLAGAGLVRRAATSGRQRHVYEVTDAGRSALVGWLTATEPDRGARSEAALRTFFLWMLEPEEQRRVLAGEEEAHRAALAAYEGRASAAASDGPAGVADRIAIERAIRHERAMVEWAAWAREQLATGGEGA